MEDIKSKDGVITITKTIAVAEYVKPIQEKIDRLNEVKQLNQENIDSLDVEITELEAKIASYK